MAYSNNLSNLFRRDITVFGVPVEVEFEFYPGCAATSEEPGCEDELTVSAVFVDEIEITHLCGESTLAEIEKKLWEMRANYD